MPAKVLVKAHVFGNGDVRAEAKHLEAQSSRLRFGEIHECAAKPRSGFGGGNGNIGNHEMICLGYQNQSANDPMVLCSDPHQVATDFFSDTTRHRGKINDPGLVGRVSRIDATSEGRRIFLLCPANDPVCHMPMSQPTVPDANAKAAGLPIRLGWCVNGRSNTKDIQG